MEIPDELIELEIQSLVERKEKLIRSKEWDKVIGIEARLGELGFLLMSIQGNPKAAALLEKYRGVM